jgi:TPR repeat protein
MPVTTVVVSAALEGAGISAAKGLASSIAGGAGKSLWARFIGNRAAEGVVAMSVVRAIDESTPGADQRPEAWWSRAGQRLIKPFLDKQVAGSVVAAVIASPEDGEAIRGTLLAALEAAGHSLDELARSLEFDAECFLDVIPAILLDELITAAAEPGSPLMEQATLASLRQVADRLTIKPTAVPPAPLAALVELVSDTGLPTVAELDPYRLGTTPSLFGNVGTYGESDPYVARTRDYDLAAGLADAAEHPRMVLVVGASKAGKTRSAFEAIREHLPTARVLFPRPGTVRQLVEHPQLANFSGETIVVWLDDLDRYVIHADPLTPALLSQLIGRFDQVVVLATLRQEQREMLRQGGELNRDTRALLDHATVIDLQPLTRDDPHESAAADLAYPGQDLTFGLAARLAGAPELLKRYDDARHADPLRHAVMRVAIDWVRVGRPDPVPEATLVRLPIDAFQADRPDLDATEQQAGEALTVARNPPDGSGRVAALVTERLPDGTRAYRPFDYLVAADDGQGHAPRPIPASLWNKALHDASPEIALAISLTAFQRGNITAAVRASEQAAVAGNVNAMFSLGVLLADHQDPPKLAAARHWYEKAAAAGNTNAMVNLGVLLAERSEPPDLAAARGWYEKAAAADDADAMFNLGVLYSDLQDPPKLAAARHWYEKAAAAGNTNAMVNLGVLLAEDGDFVGARSRYEKAAAAGHIEAVLNLGMLLADNQDPPDRAGARAWFEQAAGTGHTYAMVRLGRLGEQSDPPDFLAAKFWYEKAAKAGDIRGMNSLAVLLATCWDPPDLDAARHWHEQAAAEGDIDAMNHLGDLYAQVAKPPNIAAARSWYEKAAEAGHVDAMNSLGVLLATKPTPDLVAARQWYERAATEGNSDAMVNLGFLLSERWEPRDLPGARTWYEKAAEKGHGGAMFNLGFLLSERWEPRDLPGARTWYEKAAEAGDVDAMSNLGVLLTDQWEPPDLPAARHWLERAAESGKIQAMKALVVMLATRWDPPDRVAANYWARKVASAGETIE